MIIVTVVSIIFIDLDSRVCVIVLRLPLIPQTVLLSCLFPCRPEKKMAAHHSSKKEKTAKTIFCMWYHLLFGIIAKKPEFLCPYNFQSSKTLKLISILSCDYCHFISKLNIPDKTWVKHWKVSVSSELLTYSSAMPVMSIAPGATLIIDFVTCF